MSGMFVKAALAIRLVGAGQIPESVLERAERVASAIFDRAGVHIEWTDCRAATCASMTGPWVQFVGQRRGAAGYAVVIDDSSGYAVVRYPVVEQAAASLELDPAPLLGATIAHEIGHLLLGKAHRSRSVMTARFRREEIESAARGELSFTGEEAKRLSETPRIIAAR